MKRRLLGEAITAEQVARLPAESGPTALVRLCGTLIGAALGDRVGSFTLPAISERIHVPDGGVDAWYAAPDSLKIAETGGLIGPGRTVFQFKYRDSTRGPRPSLVAELIRSVRDDLARASPECDRYVLLTNLDLKASDRKRLAEVITARLPTLNTPPVIWGASELALQLNSVPHLRNLLFADGGLCTLDFAAEELRSAYQSLGWPTFRGRDPELGAIGSFAGVPTARLLTVLGSQYVGKTRLVIEALRPWASLVVWSATPEGAPLELFRDLDSEDRDVVLVVDRCDLMSVARLAGYASERHRLKTILIVTGTGEGLVSGKGCALHLYPLAEDDGLRLVQEITPGLSFRQASWIVEIAGGIPGLLLHAAALVRDAGRSIEDSAGSIRTRLGSLIAEKYLRGLHIGQRQALRVLALLPILGVSEEAAPELDAVARALGTSGNLVRQQLSDLRETGFVRQRGRFLEVVPPLFADYLAAEQLADPKRLLEELVLALRPGALLRFLSRLRDVDVPVVRATIAELLSRGGWFPDLATLVRNAPQFRILTPAAPREALQCLERILAGASVEQLTNELTSDARRAVVTALEDLALRADTFEGAARLLLALADAENEAWDNNATGVFTELFHWGHPEVAASLKIRGDVLRDAARDSSPRRRALVARACGEAFRPRAIGLHRAVGPAVPEPPYRPTREDVLEYGLGILAVVETLFRDPKEPVCEAARTAVVHAFRPCVYTGLLPDGLHKLALQGFSCIERVGRDVRGARERARVVTELELLIEDLKTPPSASRLPSGSGRNDALVRAEPIVLDLTESTIQDRLWQWVGPGSHQAELKRLNEPAEVTSHLDRLTAELTPDPVTLRAHFPWLTGDEAVHRSSFFRRLGEADEGRRAWPVIIDDPTGSHWAEAFAAYCVGRASRDAAQVATELDRLLVDPRLLRGVILASSWLLPGKADLERLVQIAQSVSIPKREIAREVAPSAPWRDMALPGAVRLLHALDDKTPEVREALLFPILLMSLHDGRELGGSVRDLAWSFLETVGPAVQGKRSHTWDSLAAKLGADQPDRLRIVLEHTLQHLLRRGDSISLAHDLPLSWNTLKRTDPRGALEIVLRAAMLPNAWSIADELPGLVDPARDREHLLQWLMQAGADGVRFLARSLDPNRPGFWQLVPDLILAFPDEEVGEILIGCLHTGSWSGSATGMIDRRLGEARNLQPHGEARVRTWAQRAVTVLEAWRRREQREDQEEWIWDYRVHRAELERMLRKPDSPERLWAIGRLLEDAPERRVLELLTPAEIVDALPKLPHLDRSTRAKWETWARHHGESSEHD